MGLIERYNKYLLRDHNKDYYFYNTFPVRFLKSNTSIKEIFQIFFNDGIVLLVLIYQIKLFYKIDLYFLFITWIIYYVVLLTKFFYFKIKYKGFYKPIFKCLECGKLTKITLENCQHCSSPVHKNQEEYIEKRKRSIIRKDLDKMKKMVDRLKVNNAIEEKKNSTLN
jgi:hypothetical protein